MTKKDDTNGRKAADDAMGVWIAVGAGLGIVFGSIYANIGLGVVIGAMLGLALGIVIASVGQSRASNSRAFLGIAHRL